MSLYVKIKKKLGNFTLDINLEADNETVGLLGASGCGKSMTLKCIAGIVKPDEGRIVVNNRVLFDSEKKINLSPQKRKVGYLFQNYALFPNMTVRENLRAGSRENPGKDALNKLVDEKINSFFLEGLEDKYPHQLSGGQQQRVAMARIFMNEPEILLLDEPFSALDSYLQWQLEQELVATISKFSKTALYVSHNRDEIYQICGNVSVINNGKNESLIPVKEMFEKPGTLAAALLSGCKNFSLIDECSDSSHVFAKDWGQMLKCSAPVLPSHKYIAVRAHYIQCMAEPDNSENVIACSIVSTTESVFSMIAMLRPTTITDIDNNFSKIRIETSKEEWQALKCQKHVYIKIKPENIMLLNE